MARFQNVRSKGSEGGGGTAIVEKTDASTLQKAALRLSKTAGEIAEKAKEKEGGEYVHGWLYRSCNKVAEKILDGASWLIEKVDQFVAWVKEQWQKLSMTKRVKASWQGFWEGLKNAWEGFFEPEKALA